MKQITSVFLSMMVFVIFLFNEGCKKDENLTHMTDFEYKVYTTVNNYRVSKSLGKITINYNMVGDAQAYSLKMAKGLVPYAIGDEIMTILNTWKTNWDGDASGAVVQFSESENADTIVNRMVRDPLKKEVLEGNFNLTAVGSAKDSNGKWYVTQLFIHKP